MRQLILFTIVVGALVAILWARPVSPPPSEDVPELAYVTTAHQLGVVGYRDPAGAISPDGTRFAYSEGRFIRVIAIGGGAPITLAPGNGQIRYLAWQSNDTVMAEETGTDQRWWLYNIATTQRRPDESPRPPGPASLSALMPDGRQACIVKARIQIPCGGDTQVFSPDVDAYGPIAFSADRVYFASPNGNGMVALWTADLRTKQAHRLTSFSRDAYAPSIGGDTVVFKTQTYRTTLADAPADGGSTRQLTTFQSETPSYHPTQSLMAFTYGTWRRIVDDAKYPDIAQEIGTINTTSRLPADRPLEVIAQSESEDQAMTWSPNGKWIAFHTHREMSDDVWLRPADGKQPDKRITFLGRGAEVGWPRWSPDGKAVLLDGARKSDGNSVIYTIGVDQDSGTVTSELREVRADGFAGDITHAEWLGNDTVIGVAKEAPGRHVIVTLPIRGGTPHPVHRFETEHDFPGLAVSSDGRFVAFVAPAPDGFYQIFRKAIAGGAAAVQVTSDPSNKTQPAWSPDGQRVAFTIWSYDATFYSFKTR